MFSHRVVFIRISSTTIVLLITDGISLFIHTVHPVPAPCSTKALASSRIREGGSSQKEMLFSRGNAINYIVSKCFILTPYITIRFRLYYHIIELT